jgi:hypothetical protein
VPWHTYLPDSRGSKHRSRGKRAAERYHTLRHFPVWGGVKLNILKLWITISNNLRVQNYIKFLIHANIIEKIAPESGFFSGMLSIENRTAREAVCFLY